MALVAAMYRDTGLSQGDLDHAVVAFRRAALAAVAEPMAWTNPQSGRRGSITATRYGYDRDERPCREFRSELEGAGGRTALTVACQDAQGNWQLRPS